MAKILLGDGACINLIKALFGLADKSDGHIGVNHPQYSKGGEVAVHRYLLKGMTIPVSHLVRIPVPTGGVLEAKWRPEPVPAGLLDRGTIYLTLEGCYVIAPKSSEAYSIATDTKYTMMEVTHLKKDPCMGYDVVDRKESMTRQQWDDFVAAHPTARTKESWETSRAEGVRLCPVSAGQFRQGSKVSISYDVSDKTWFNVSDS